MHSQRNPTGDGTEPFWTPPERKVWVAPEIVGLPRLTDLTLQTGSPIPGFGDPGSGSTVF